MKSSIALKGWLVVAMCAASSPLMVRALEAQSSAATSPRSVAVKTAAQMTAPTAAPKELLGQYCVACHNQKVRNADLALDALDTADVRRDAPAWEKVVKKLRAGLMPPAGSRRPSAAEHDGLVTWLESALDRAATQTPNVGRPETFHRLNRAEYRNAIRELVKVDIDVSELLPADNASYGFDNMAGALKLDQALMERYLAAAERISAVALGRPTAPVSAEFRLPTDLPQDQHIEGLPLGTRGGLAIKHTFPVDAEYLLAVELMCGSSNAVAVCDGSGGWADSHELEVTVDGQRIRTFTLEPTPFGTLVEGAWKNIRLPLKAGQRSVGVAFVAPPEIEEVESNYLRFKKPIYLTVANTNVALATYQPAVAALTITGPFNQTGPGDTASRRAILSCRPTGRGDDLACAKTILTALARRAYRRSVTDADVQPLLQFFREGLSDGGFEAGIALALQRVLVSPQFLFRIEEDRTPTSAQAGSYRISDADLASRLSFFLWSSSPDDELLNLAIQGRLREPATLAAQVRRMLRDARANALVENFAGQWLQLRNLDARVPSDFLFPNFDQALRAAFRKETELFFGSIVREDRSVMDLLGANYTFVNERLAEHYDIPYVKGSRFVRVTLPETSPRRGLLGQGSILLVTSHAIRTSPVIRGKWILENILGTPPPAPPANVPPLKENEPQRRGDVLSVRERVAEHRRNPVCASCHNMIDPLGFALENFDAVGQWRTLDESRKPIDASGMLPDGSKFQDLNELRTILLQHPERIVPTLTEKLFTYALGRGLDYYDMPAVRAIVRDSAKQQYRFSSLVLGIVNSPAFQRRQIPAATQVALH